MKTNRRVLVVDDEQDIVEIISYNLSKQNFEVRRAYSGRECITIARQFHPHLIVMDIRMPEIDGINGIQLIRKEFEDIKIIVLTMYDDQQMISKMMEMGANAYLTKTTDPEEIYEAILTCMNDDFYFNDLVNNAVMGKLMQKKNVRQHYGTNTPVQFNEKELKILQLLAEDKTTEEISKIIFLSPRTIETIRQNMKTKVDAKTIGGLIMYGMRNKLIE